MILVIVGNLVLRSLTRFVGTMHNIRKVKGSNPDHHKKKDSRKFDSTMPKKRTFDSIKQVITPS